MQTCFHSVGLPTRSLHEVIHMAADKGYEAVEINCETLPWAPPHLTPAADAATRKAVVSAARSRGIAIAAIGAHIGMVGGDAALRRAAIRFVNGCSDLAADLGAPIVHILSGSADDGEDRERAWTWFCDAVKETTLYACSKGVNLGVEAIAGHVFHKVDDYHRLYDELPDVPFHVNFDPSHLIVQGEDPIRVVRELAARINHVHLKDGKGTYPAFEFPPLGAGDIDFPALVHGLGQSGYNGALSVEYEAQVYGYELSEAEILDSGKAFVDALTS